MHNCLILGAGRTGTSMVAGTLAKAGYFMGEQFWQPNSANPKGFFEDIEVNGINEAILSPHTPWTPPPFRPGRLHRWLRRSFFTGKPGEGQRWLARLPLDMSLISSPMIEARIQALAARAPYCFKDPRFCYTLPLWRPWLHDTRFVCVFREPNTAAASMVAELHSSRKLADLKMAFADCLEVWRSMYSHVLERHRKKGEWLFLHYDQMLDGSGLERLAAFLDVVPDPGFPDSTLRRTQTHQEIPESISIVYRRLLCLAYPVPG